MKLFLKKIIVENCHENILRHCEIYESILRIKCIYLAKFRKEE